MNNLTIAFSMFLLLLTACNNNTGKDVNNKKPGGKEMADLNTYLIEKDRERIISYVERKGLNMKETKSGLWFMIKTNGSGGSLKDKDKLIVQYKCSLLDGTLIYSSEALGAKEIVLGRSEIEAGLNEGLRMLGHRGEATFILPPFLGFGLTGDNKSIPPRAILVYEIKIMN